ncbi:MAG TPA: hypothetical protein VFZ67_09620 [Nitrososphaera sp.]
MSNKIVDGIKGIIADAIIVLSSNGNEEVLDREARERRIRTPEIIVLHLPELDHYHQKPFNLS